MEGILVGSQLSVPEATAEVHLEATRGGRLPAGEEGGWWVSKLCSQTAPGHLLCAAGFKHTETLLRSPWTCLRQESPL